MKIEKPAGIITSLGRTGTLFLSELLKNVVPDAVSYHEVGYLNIGQYVGWSEKFKRVIDQIKIIGVGNIIVRKAFNQWGLKRISNRCVTGRIERTQAAKEIVHRRKAFIDSTDRSLYLESSSEYYGLLAAFREAFNAYRAVFVVRDGRDWVRSRMNFGRCGYERGWLHQMLSPPFPKAKEIPNDPNCHDWDSMSTFQKVSWAWNALNGFAIKAKAQDSNIKIIRFEDIFMSDKRCQNLNDLLDFLILAPMEIKKHEIKGRLDVRIHQSTGDFPAWPKWSDTQINQFNHICGNLMEDLGYY